MLTGTFFVNRDNNTLIRVREVDTQYAHIETLYPTTAHYAMPIADYDSIFISMFKPALPEDLKALGEKVRPPANAPAGWSS